VRDPDAGATTGKLILVGGGARSGKSRFALGLAEGLGQRRIFIATAEALDGEMADRIARHRAERGSTFETIEEPLRLAETLDACGRDVAGCDVVLVDCLTLWVSNLLGRGLGAGDLAACFERLRVALDRRRSHVLLVTNEVGMGLVPETPLGRAFRDAIGALHQRLAAMADEIYLAALGTVLRLQPAPVQLVRQCEIEDAR
jgi:adenosylcobinamide kinase / adenosylcobinamide-phosphate guanylyltransferase